MAWALTTAACLWAGGASALVNDDATLLEGAKLCTRYLPRHEREYGIPVHLLAAIASTESGRFHRALGLNLPWPWTINVEGRGYFFDSKEQAIAAVRHFQARGFQSIDVGCMQVNLQHHPYAFANLEQAFDPGYNVAYAAQFLKHNFQDEKSWRKATADYHSHTRLYGEQYARMVFDAWNRIINKVDQARAGLPLMVASAETAAPPAVTRSVTARRNPFIARRGYHSPHFHEITLARGTARERGVLVIRPEPSATPVSEVAKLDDFVSQAPAAVPAEDGKGARIVRLEGGKVVSSTLGSAAKGQFQPHAHMTSVAYASAGSPAPGKNLFVFDN